MVHKCFDKTFAGANKSGGAVVCANKSAIKSEMILNQQLEEELDKPITRKLENEKYSHLLKTILEVLILRICN